MLNGRDTVPQVMCAAELRTLPLKLAHERYGAAMACWANDVMCTVYQEAARGKAECIVAVHTLYPGGQNAGMLPYVAALRHMQSLLGGPALLFFKRDLVTLEEATALGEQLCYLLRPKLPGVQITFDAVDADGDKACVRIRWGE